MKQGDEAGLGEKLDTLIRLIALALCEGKTRKEQIALLDKASFQPKAIAEILDTTPNTVSVTLSNLRKNKTERRKIGTKETIE